MGHPAISGKISPHLGLGGGGAGDCTLSDVLKLPDSFGNIYLGQDFVAYIGVVNHILRQTLLQVELCAKLQGPSGMMDLADCRLKRGAKHQPPNPAPELPTGQSLDMVVEHRLKELGTHTLRVSVTYREYGSPVGTEPKLVRKFYRFTVLNPLEVSLVSKLVLGSSSAAVVQASVKNATAEDVMLESFEFLPEIDSGFSAEMAGGQAMVARAMSPEPQQVPDSYSSGSLAAPLRSPLECLDHSIVLAPDESHNFVYRIEAEGEDLLLGQLGGRNIPLGRVELCWRTNMGEVGSILSDQAVLHIPPSSQVVVSVTGLPERMQYGEVCECEVAVRNLTERQLRLQLQFRSEAMSGLSIQGRSFMDLGQVGVLETFRCQVGVLPLAAGLQDLRGCVLVDMDTAKEYPQPSLGGTVVEIGAGVQPEVPTFETL